MQATRSQKNTGRTRFADHTVTCFDSISGNERQKPWKLVSAHYCTRSPQHQVRRFLHCFGSYCYSAVFSFYFTFSFAETSLSISHHVAGQPRPSRDLQDQNKSQERCTACAYVALFWKATDIRLPSSGERVARNTYVLRTTCLLDELHSAQLHTTYAQLNESECYITTSCQSQHEILIVPTIEHPRYIQPIKQRHRNHILRY